MSEIKVFEITGANAISMQSGDKLYRLLHPRLAAGESVKLDFANVALFASPFFNASIGLLLKDITIQSLQQQLSFLNLSEVGRELLNHVISNAIAFYKNSDRVTKAIDQSGLSEEDE